jgi:peptidoglycan/LPS O-acetylase OafA/YrhL
MNPSTAHPNSRGYRPDIDGLRAISVLAVLAFHAGFTFLPGGFIGVDVFFVISGFLITGLLLAEHKSSGGIDLPSFWARRVRRLAPALLLVLLAVMVASMLLLERISGEVGAVARATLATLAINANHFFLTESGDYFGAAAETNPLLHMWSLSGEEQFYVVWPVLLTFLMKLAMPRRVWLIVVALVSSLALSCYWGVTAPPKGFFLMPSRAWELLAGALLAIGTRSDKWRTSSAAALTLTFSGVVLIIASAALLNGAQQFPGPMAALPVAGAMLIIGGGAAMPANLVTTMLGTSVMVYIGKLSYPLYLWHWPVLVIFRSRRLYEASPFMDAVALTVAGVLAVLTYEFVERSVWARFKGFSTRRVIAYGVTGTATLVAMAILVGAWARFGWGYSEREILLDNSRKDVPSLNCLFSDRYPDAAAFEQCYPLTGKATILLWGDSHANHWQPALSSAASVLDWNLAVLTMRGCRPLPGPVGTTGCIDFNDRVMRNLREWKRDRHLSAIVLAARWPEGTGTLVPSIADRALELPGKFFDTRASSQQEALAYFEAELRSVLRLSHELDLRVLLLLSSPVQRFSAAHCLAIKLQDGCFVSTQDLLAYSFPAERVMRKVVSDFPNVSVVDPKRFMCRGDRCPVILDDMIAYTDDDHISASYAKAAAVQFKSAMGWLGSREETAAVDTASLR